MRGVEITSGAVGRISMEISRKGPLPVPVVDERATVGAVVVRLAAE